MLIMIVFFGLISGYIFAFAYEKLIMFIGKKVHKRKIAFLGYKLHHSIYGLVVMLTALLFIAHLDFSVFLAFFGLAIIIQHYFTGDGLTFITKE